MPRDQYFLFAAGMKDRSYMLLVNETPRVGTIPGRVNTLLSYVTPQGNNPVRMPPQSGENLGNPPVRKPPLTAEQVQTIRTWASSAAPATTDRPSRSGRRPPAHSTETTRQSMDVSMRKLEAVVWRSAWKTSRA